MTAPLPAETVTRFAPSPSGLLHRGHAFSALTAWMLAREHGGRFLLRIEDIDAERSRPEFDAAIFEDLAWLGLNWETPVRRQSQHLADYAGALERLRERGLVYRCFKTRAEILADIGRAPHDPPQPYRGAPPAPTEEKARLDAGEPYAWRLSLEAAREALGPAWEALDFLEQGQGPNGEHGLQQAAPATAGDVILARKGLGVAYHLAVVVDDALQGVTCVSRGWDLFEAVHIQRLLQALLGLPSPTYHHHRLLLGDDGKRLAKRDKAGTLRALRGAGVTAAALRAELGFG
ncbi:MAG: tRNA glutamyl-Q(34) synthetase GluQRS [Caulobacteraceae bacterium]|nr:tRNA glutamyl-Q(34) synthetase GluQRS [Caulobacteraceae bacterium]